MALLGRVCLLLALVVCAYGIGASIYGVRTRTVGVGRVRAALGVRAGGHPDRRASLILEVAFLRNDFAFNTVADTSSRTTPTFYKAAAVWSSQEGSLLLWAWLMSLWSSLALFLTRRRIRDVAAYATAIMLGFGGFFISLMVFYAQPFATTSPAPSEGVGLDPLLRFPTMMIHPPMLYSGYTLCTIPLAFGMGALLARRVDAEWIRVIRRFAFAAWFFLGIGILLGARWSYSELGWGGYWGWDAVENASLMPWLTGTAFLHSLMIQEKRGMLKVWNVSLVLATGTLAIMGTFLVRSGVLNSIHAFGGQTLGVPFVVLIAVLIAGSIYLVVTRREMLRTEHRLDSLLSRESAFLANNVVLVALCLRDLLGNLLPADLRGADRPGSLGRAALVRPLHGAAGADPGAAQRDRAGDRLASRDARQRAPQLPRADRRRAGDARRAAGCGSAREAVRARDVLLRGVRRRQHRPGVLPRDARALGDGRRGAPDRAGGARAAQPQALRRLHRAHRDRGPVRRGRRLLLVPARVRARPLARAVLARGRLHDQIRAPDRERDPRLRLLEHAGRPRTERDHPLRAGRDPRPRHRAHRRDPQPRRGARREQARPSRDDAAIRARGSTPPKNRLRARSGI